MNALSLVLSDDDVRNGGPRLEDEHGILFTRLVLSLALAACQCVMVSGGSQMTAIELLTAALSVELDHLPVE